VKETTFTGPGFYVRTDPCLGRSLGYQEECSFEVCTNARDPGPYAASLTRTTTGGNVHADVTATVLPATPGLDPSFASTGAVLAPASRGATLLNNGSTIGVWGPSAFTFVSVAGAVWTPQLGNIPLSPEGFSLNELSGLRAGGPGQGIYGLMGGAGRGAVIR